jgi:hypothetical protein
MERDAAAYLQLIEAKDESIVRLTNQLHELELQAKIDQVPMICSVGAREKWPIGSAWWSAWQSPIPRTLPPTEQKIIFFLFENHISLFAYVLLFSSFIFNFLLHPYSSYFPIFLYPLFQISRRNGWLLLFFPPRGLGWYIISNMYTPELYKQN